MYSYFLALVLASHLLACDAFTMPSRSSISHRRVKDDLKASTDLLEGIRSPIESYVGIWTPTFKEIAPSLPEALVHWGHGGAMATVLFAMGGIGTFLGWQIRLGNGNESYSFTLQKSAREMHPIVMGLATFFFLLGGQGGLVLLATQGKDILHSDHALTAFVGLGLLLVQALLPKLFDKTDAARTAHAYLGTATMGVLLLHAYNGLNLGLSF